MSPTPGNESAQPAQPVAGTSGWSVLIEGLRQLAELFFPKLAKVTKPLLVAFAVIVVLPLAWAFLAAQWLALLKDVDNTAVAGVRTWYLETINEGFSIEDVSSRSHARLDYLHLIRHDLVPRKASARLEMPISLQPWQRFELEFNWVEPSSLPGQRLCELPEQPLDLVHVLLNGVPLATLPKGASTVKVESPWWTRHDPSFPKGSTVQSLSVRLTAEAVEQLPACAMVRVEGGLRVYKTLLKPNPEGR